MYMITVSRERIGSVGVLACDLGAFEGRGGTTDLSEPNS